HCLEWLDDNNTSNLFASLSDSLKSWKRQLDIKKTEHLFEPKDDNPIVINECKFYESYLDVFSNGTCSYDDIKMIVYSNHENFTNGVRTKKSMYFKLYIYFFDS